MHLPLAIDIETVPNQSADAYVDQEKFEAPANYKDPEKISQAIMQKRQAALDKAALRWWTGKVICIGIVDVDNGWSEVLAGDDEAAILDDFFSLLSVKFRDYYLTSKSGKDFDFPFLVGRAMANNIGLPPQLFSRYQITDVNEIFGRHSTATQRGKLSDYAWGLGIDGKMGSGGDIGHWYNLARLGDEAAWKYIRDYCLRDTEIVAKILKRYQKPYVQSAPSATGHILDGIPFARRD